MPFPAQVTQALQQASCDTSSNPLLRNIWAAVQRYNALPAQANMTPDQRADAVELLDGISEKCATYMTDKAYFPSKPAPGGAPGTVTSKRHFRFRAFGGLMAQVFVEIRSFGGKAIAAPADFTSAGENYFLERMDPAHRPGFALTEHYGRFLGRQLKGVTFWDRMSQISRAAFDAWEQAWNTDKQADPNAPAPPLPDDLKQVYGYDVDAKWDECVYFDGSNLKSAKDDSVFTSADKETVCSLKGWAIWVCSMPMVENPATRLFHNYIFSGTHEKGVHHHSSFLGGKPVLAAGEWIVDATGNIQVITGKSGHYRPSIDELFNFVNTFPQQIPGSALIRVDMAPAKPWKYYRVSDLRANMAQIQAGRFPHVPGTEVARVITQYAPNCHPPYRVAANMG